MVTGKFYYESGSDRAIFQILYKKGSMEKVRASSARPTSVTASSLPPLALPHLRHRGKPGCISCIHRNATEFRGGCRVARDKFYLTLGNAEEKEKGEDSVDGQREVERRREMQ